MCNMTDGDNGFWESFPGNLHSTITPINFPDCTSAMYNGTGSIEILAPGFPNYNTTNVVDIPSQLGFRSKHPAGALFVYCDGSVHFLNDFLQYDTYQRLADRHDGRPVLLDP